MPESRSGAVGLFPEFTRPDGNDEEPEMRTRGIVPSQDIRQMVQNRQIHATPAIEEAHIQPASLDLRLGDIAHRVRASFLPGPNQTVESRIKELRMTRVDLTSAAVFEKDCVYIVPLLEEVNLPADIYGKANPKSTTGRLDIFTRLITDYGVEFDRVPAGYKGKLYAEVVSRTFTVAIRAGMRLSQLRFVQGNPVSGDKTIRDLNQEAAEPGEIIAFRAKRYAPAIELDRIDYYPTEEFWEVRHQNPSKNLILEPGDFYILASRERVRVPPELA